MTVIKLTRRQFPKNAAVDLYPLPYESILSSIWLFAWRNGLGPGEIRKCCSRSASYVSGYRNAAYRWYAPDVFFQTSGWVTGTAEIEAVCTGDEWFREDWWAPVFRYCPLCLGGAYHSFWHQSNFITHCPVDGSRLEFNCNHCDALLHGYAFSRHVLGAVFFCRTCRKPISGAPLAVASRLESQKRAHQIGASFQELDQWWRRMSKMRDEFCSMVSLPPLTSYAPWLKLAHSTGQWLVDLYDAPQKLPIPHRTVPPLVILQWRVRKHVNNDARNFITSRRPGYVKFARATAVYRATLRRLEWTIAAEVPYTSVDYQRYLALSKPGGAHTSEKLNLHLLALCFLRLRYETYASIFTCTSADAQLDLEICDRFGEFQNEQVRLSWRALFIASYASLYWLIVASRTIGDKYSSSDISSLILGKVDIDYDFENGHVIKGSVAFPAVDALNLSLFPLARGLKLKINRTHRSRLALLNSWKELL